MPNLDFAAVPLNCAEKRPDMCKCWPLPQPPTPPPPVYAFQLTEGLLADGEAGDITLRALGLR